MRDTLNFLLGMTVGMISMTLVTMLALNHVHELHKTLAAYLKWSQARVSKLEEDRDDADRWKDGADTD